MQKITPCLWFDSQAEEAVDFYTAVFKNSKIVAVSRYGEASAKVSGQPKGSVLTILFQLEGQEFLALNGGPVFHFTPAISLIVHCETQKEIDQIWNKLSADKASEQCGWLKDRYGVSWQIVPTVLQEMTQDKDAKKSDRMMAALINMKKLDLAALQKAFEG
jgi:predicted 3-demethylubiquinone-9 3-methyltransferase (glyoxalase superfamily)